MAGGEAGSAGDLQRWSVLQLSVFRNRDGTFTVSFIHRTVQGKSRFDRRLDVAQLNPLEGDPAREQPLEAALLAVQTLQANRLSSGLS